MELRSCIDMNKKNDYTLLYLIILYLLGFINGYLLCLKFALH